MFDLYALLIAPLLIVSFGLFGYVVKNKIFKTIKLNAYFLGMLSYFAIFEIISIPSIALHITFRTFKWINVFVAAVLFIISLYVYIRDYKIKKINHKYRFLKRYNENKLFYQFSAITLIVFSILFLFFPYTRLRDDDLHWIITIKDNITSNTLLQIYPENGSFIKFIEMYAFNAYTLFFSTVVGVLKVNVLAFVLLSIRILWLFQFIFSLKDFVNYFTNNKNRINAAIIIVMTMMVFFTNYTNFYEMPFFIVYSSVGQRLALILFIPFVQVTLELLNKKVTREDYLFYFAYALLIIFFATTLVLIIMSFTGFIVILSIITKKGKQLGPVILFSFITLLILGITGLIFSKVGTPKMYYVDEFCIKYGCEVFQVKIEQFFSYENWLKWFSNSYFIRYLIPIIIVIFAKSINKEYKYLAWFLVFLTVVINPLTFALAKRLELPVILIDRLNYYYAFIGYFLYFPALVFIINGINSKSDIVKGFQILMFMYLCMSTMFIDTIYKRNVNFANAYEFTLYSPHDWDFDDYYPIDRNQVQAIDSLRSIYEGKYYVFSTSSDAINYRIRLFDSDAQIITPRKRPHTNVNFKDDWYSCLNTTNYLSAKTLNICKETVNHDKKMVIIIYRAYKNNFSSYVEKNFKKYYENTKYIVYKKDL